MMDLGTISAGVSLVETVFRLAAWLKGTKEVDVISAYFDANGNRVEGSDKIEIQRILDKNDPSVIWWFSVKPIDGYVFVRAPVVESGIYEVLGTIEGEKNPDARYWRYVAKPLEGRIYGGSEPNAKVDFYIMGYKPRALIKGEWMKDT